MAAYVYGVIVEHRATGKIDRFTIESTRKISAEDIDQLAFEDMKRRGYRREDYRIEIEEQQRGCG